MSVMNNIGLSLILESPISEEGLGRRYVGFKIKLFIDIRYPTSKPLKMCSWPCLCPCPRPCLMSMSMPGVLFPVCVQVWVCVHVQAYIRVRVDTHALVRDHFHAR
jgi:hypothetical protein